MLQVNIEKIIPVTDARDMFNKIIDDVEGTDELYVLTKNGKPAAVIVGVNHLEKLTGETQGSVMNKVDEMPAPEAPAQTLDEPSETVFASADDALPTEAGETPLVAATDSMPTIDPFNSSPTVGEDSLPSTEQSGALDDSLAPLASNSLDSSLLSTDSSAGVSSGISPIPEGFGASPASTTTTDAESSSPFSEPTPPEVEQPVEPAPAAGFDASTTQVADLSDTPVDDQDGSGPVLPPRQEN